MAWGNGRRQAAPHRVLRVLCPPGSQSSPAPLGLQVLHPGFIYLFFFLLKGCGVSISLVQSEIGNLMDQQAKKMKRGFNSWF